MNTQPHFTQLSRTLHYFTIQLVNYVVTNQCSDIFFLSREGQILKHLFDHYVHDKIPNLSCRTHYLKVSRRSTFLPSLDSISDEDFYTLFRQYRKISVNNFLESLTLREYSSTIAQDLHIDDRNFDEVKIDLPTSQLFSRLLNSDIFKSLYETKRKDSQRAFIAYLQSHFPNNVLPDSLTLVDVGWKGTIQDNIYRCLKLTCDFDITIDGCYIGLVCDPPTMLRNRKHGLVFSTMGDDSKNYGYPIFKEFQTLFEIFLYADHGAIREYSFGNDGAITVIEDAYSEYDMIEQFIAPSVKPMLSAFYNLSFSFGDSLFYSELSFLRVVVSHACMVFRYDPITVQWLSSLTHREHFGLFQYSEFPNVSRAKSLCHKMRWTWDFIRNRRLPNSSFWPYVTLKQEAAPGVAELYVGYRLLQALIRFVR